MSDTLIWTQTIEAGIQTAAQINPVMPEETEELLHKLLFTTKFLPVGFKKLDLSHEFLVNTEPVTANYLTTIDFLNKARYAIRNANIDMLGIYEFRAVNRTLRAINNLVRQMEAELIDAETN